MIPGNALPPVNPQSGVAGKGCQFQHIAACLDNPRIGQADLHLQDLVLAHREPNCLRLFGIQAQCHRHLQGYPALMGECLQICPGQRSAYAQVDFTRRDRLPVG
ncbi:hypothetical protein D3C78_1659050 [compost metagenome]